MKITAYRKLTVSMVLGIAIFIGHTSTAFAQIPYSDPTNHYSFTLPSEWKEIPISVINQYVDEAVRQTQGQRTEYAAGFQLSEKDYFKYPYILIQNRDVNTPSYSQIEKTFLDSNFQGSIKQKIDDYSELLANATFEKPFFDKKRNIIFMNTQLDVTNVGKVNGLIAMFLGKQSITQLNFYAVSTEYSQWIPVFNSIIDSFQYDIEYTYSPEDFIKNDSPSLFKSVIEKGLSGTVVGLIAGAIVWSLRKKSNSLPK